MTRMFRGTTHQQVTQAGRINRRGRFRGTRQSWRKTFYRFNEERSIRTQPFARLRRYATG